MQKRTRTSSSVAIPNLIWGANIFNLSDGIWFGKPSQNVKIRLKFWGGMGVLPPSGYAYEDRCVPLHRTLGSYKVKYYQEQLRFFRNWRQS